MLPNLVLVISLLMLFASFQYATSQAKSLSNKETRNEIMNEIANDNKMSKVMIEVMMNSIYGRMMMQENQMTTFGNPSTMMKMMQKNPEIMQSIFSSMMERAINTK
jgi:hypothetical protein